MRSGSKRAAQPKHGSTAAAAAELQQGVMPIEGPAGNIEHLRVSGTDSPEAIEHCLRRLFGLPQTSGVVIREPGGCAVPLGAGLLDGAPPPGAGHYRAEIRRHGTREPKLEDVRLRAHDDAAMVWRRPQLRDVSRASTPQTEEALVLQQALHPFPDRLGSHATEPSLPGLVAVPTPPSHMHMPVKADANVSPTAKSAPSNVMAATGKFMADDVVQDEFQFWCGIAAAAQGFDSTTATPVTLSGDKPWVRTNSEMSRSRSRLDHFRRSEQVDTSPHHIDCMYDSWCDEEEDGVLWESVLRERLKVDCNISLAEEFVAAALARVRERFHDDGGCGDGRVSRIVFASLWQRLILGFVCQRVGEVDSPSGAEPGIRLIEYTERDSLKDRRVSENAFLFGGHERNRENTATGGRPGRGPTSRWAWIETSRNDLLMKMGVKFFLHPVATEDLMHAARKGTTKIDRYRHQYFVSLELYALDAAVPPNMATPEKVSVGGDAEQHGEVGPRITRSTMSLLATGNPPTSAKPSTARDWLLSVVNDVDHQSRADRDPLDRFSSDQTAARKVLQSVLDDLRAHKRQREYQADFLLYSIIDRAAGELTPIYNAYGRRLRWLQDRLDAGKLGAPKAYVDEVSRVRLELQELRQWVGQIKGIILHLECDCRSSTGGAAEQGIWNFGADARGQGKSVLVFLRHTQDYLEQAADRLSVLEDLGRTFVAATERNKSDFMNQTLFVLTIATATFLPAQFLAGVFGMNFVDGEGRPSMPELTYKYGYPIFWGLVVAFFLTGIVLSCCCVRCPKGAAPRTCAAGPGTTSAAAPKQVS